MQPLVVDNSQTHEVFNQTLIMPQSGSSPSTLPKPCSREARSRIRQDYFPICNRIGTDVLFGGESFLHLEKKINQNLTPKRENNLQFFSIYGHGLETSLLKWFITLILTHVIQIICNCSEIGALWSHRCPKRSKQSANGSETLNQFFLIYRICWNIRPSK